MTGPTHLVAAPIVAWLAATLASTLLAYDSASPNKISPQDRAFLQDLEHRGVLYFWEQADHGTGLVLDRASADGGRAKGPSRDVASIAATGFGLTAICIGVEHGWIPRDQALERVRTTLTFFASQAESEHGWFYHWMNVSDGARKWDSETSSVDTAFLLAGVLTSGAYFAQDPEIPKLAKEIFDRVDFQWMLAGDPLLLSHGWKRGKGFLKYKWDVYNEASLLYLLAIGSPSHPINSNAWYAWQRPYYSYGSFDFISGGPLFTHQYSHAWVDFRNRRDRGFVDFYLNSINATRANRFYCLSLSDELPNTFGPNIWGITASDGPKGYRIYGEIKAFDPVDGTVAPSAAGGSLMFTPDLSIPSLRAMLDRFGDRVYGRYGFVDGYNPSVNWFASDVVGIDVGITLLSAENLLTGNVWRWFMGTEPISRGMDLAGFSSPPRPDLPASTKDKPAGSKRTRQNHAPHHR
ncbi:MAG TPA: glucoamylase family protein [Bryobacteraceae bacterium]|nr:glucoamylase family protein [Bryobacteraceae bacterium]